MFIIKRHYNKTRKESNFFIQFGTD